MKYSHQKQDDRGRAGFTLMEVLIAMSVFAISFLGFYRLQIISVEGNADAGRVTTAAVCASDIIERIHAMDYEDDLLEDDGDDGMAGLDDLGDGVADETITTNDGLYTVTWNVVDEYPLRNVKTVRVRVAQVGGIAADKAITFDYYKSKY